MASSPLKHSYSFTSSPSPSSPDFQAKHSLADVLRWDEAQVAHWLQECNLGQYEQLFVDNNITGNILFELDYKLLRQLNITTVGERIRLSVAIKKFQRQCLAYREPIAQVPAPLPPTGGSASSLPLPASGSPGPTSPRFPPTALYQPDSAPPQPHHHHSTPVSPRSVHTLDPHPLSNPSFVGSPRLGPQPPPTLSASSSFHYGQSPVSTPHSPAPLSTTAPFTSKRRPRPTSSHFSVRSERSPESIYRLNENIQTALLGSPTVPVPPTPKPHHPRRVPRSKGGGPPEASDTTLDSLRTQLSEFFGTTSGSDITHLADSLSLRKQQNGARRCVRVMGGSNETRLVDVTDAPDGRTILNRILNSFQIFTDTDRYSLFSVSGVEGSAKSLSDEELFVLCSSSQRLEKEKLILRMKHLPYNNNDMRRRRDLNETIRILEQIPVDRSAPITAEATSPGPYPPERTPKLSNQSQKKVANFFGERPPSELISSNLAQYFPGNEEKARFSMFRASTIQDKRKSRGFPSFLPSTGPAALLRAKGSTPSMVALPPHPPLPLPNGGPPSRTMHPNRHSRSISPPKPASSSLTDLPTTWGPADHSIDTASPRPSTPEPLKRSSLGPQRPPSHTLSDPAPPPANLEDHDDDTGGNSTVEPDAPCLSGDDEPVEPESFEAPSKWIQGALIGMGSFGNVYLGLNALSGELMAVKQVDIPQENSPSEARKKLMLDALQFEIKILQDLRHSHIVRYLGSQMDDQHLNIFLEYVPGGSVAAMLANYGPLQETLVRSFVRQILKGLLYLHEREIIHRDIKGGNILVDIKGGIKISDFGISKKIENEEDRLSIMSNRASLKGSVFWMAPEVVKKTHYTRKADIWSLGCLVIEMLTGEHPFPNFTEMQAMFKIGSNTSPTIPHGISDDAHDFLTQTLALNFLERPTADVLLNHPFIQEAK
ncbi:ATP binding [Dimargaris cristalligena]|nr:ATP binding [Dimargaris cristalligena]